MKKVYAIFMSWMLILGLATPGLGQFTDPAQAAYYEALDQIQLYGRHDIGLELLMELINDYPNSPWALTARFQVGHQQDTAEESIAIYQHIASDYPGTLDEALARLNILRLQYPVELEAWLTEASILAEEYRSPLIEEILAGSNVETNIATVRDLPNVNHLVLAKIYTKMWGRIALQNRQVERALPLVIFLRNAIEPTGVMSGFGHDIQFSLMRMQLPNGTPTPGIVVDPNVTIQAPSEGSVTGPNPVLSATISVGDYRHVQASLSKTEITLDGVDIKAQTSFRSEINRILEEDVTFETVYLSADLGPLSPGTHTITLTVPVEDYRGGPGLTTVTRTFTVDPQDPQDPPDDPTSDTLPAIKDTTIYDRGPHKNEGANPRLLLKKVQGKPAHFLVGFDTANLDTNGLTKATLVLTIDSSQNVTGWGNGRPIRARRVLTEWAEGNGKSLELPNNQQASGSGEGATWFSPADANIANNQADSAVTWSGGMSFTAPSTAPTVTITNHQSGEIAFEVTEDLLLGAPHGWLVSRDQDVGSQVAFHSREAGAALAPRLLLEYGGPLAGPHHPANPLALLASMRTQPIATTQALWSEGQSSLISLLDGNPPTSKSNSIVTLKPLEASPESRPGLRQALRQNPMLAAVGEQFVGSLVGLNPITQGLAGTAYRGWLELG